MMLSSTERVIVGRRGSRGGDGASVSVSASASASTSVAHVARDVSTVELSNMEDGSGDTEQVSRSRLTGPPVLSSLVVTTINDAAAAAAAADPRCLFFTASASSATAVVLFLLPLLLLLGPCTSCDTGILTSAGCGGLSDVIGDCALLSRGANARRLPGDTFMLPPNG
ncbi:hypothetical protein G7054_g10875 [Neopestalotiopsis clavispora]|nr:hypothetical protein G7054_g10875 [Neopestalotiopsis clavispora]